nr:serine/threonine-protein kinase 11-interacting protein-like isoform X2 [Ipomoea trifida]
MENPNLHPEVSHYKEFHTPPKMGISNFQVMRSPIIQVSMAQIAQKKILHMGNILHFYSPLLAGASVDYFRAYVLDLGDHHALEQLRRILCFLTSLKVFSVLLPPARDPSPLLLLPFTRLKVLELRICDLSTSAARGLLQLRQSLKKLICHNSTVSRQKLRRPPNSSHTTCAASTALQSPV